MKIYLKKLLKSISIGLLCILVLTFMITLFNYINIIGGNFLNIFKIIIPLISIFISGFIMGKLANKNGWLEGIKVGLIFIFLLSIINFFLTYHFNIKDLILYVLILCSSILGSIFGINKKEIN